MADTADLITEVAAAVEALSPAPVRMASDYRTDREVIPEGTNRYQLQIVPSGFSPDSNVQYQLAVVRLFLRHKLANPANERVHTEGTLQTWIKAVTNRSFWLDLGSVNRIEDPLSDVSISREGNVVSFEMTITLALNA